MNKLVIVALIVLAFAVVTLLWGYNYTSTHQLSSLANMFGNVDSTYTLANNAIVVGGVGVLLGIALLIGGLVKKKSQD